ncbi:alpha-tubulin N-acetyltransferase 1-like isoform X2 [Cydia pomonella]|uniref:alpha-tubulin N-acetyltransferase 1-like isoform X2 n=1 Tax=Cydia pomonella TaxID=82600 RepID=UPI002ADDD516|nr:alpha-tubulin N-acetyltransferase 1-like isoform X2 [Cydia pomonella]
MECTTPVNYILSDEITKVNHTLIPPGHQLGDVRTVRIVQENLGRLIDSFGVQSAAAQGLSKAITTAEKLRNAPGHVLYLLKDATANNGHGELIGFLKVAYKHLYLFDEREKVREMEPLCVLDFYVSGARQRCGNGKKLFDFMLQDTNSRAQDLAVDGPSSKMETFLAKNYGIDHLIRQSNNFAISPAFFHTACDASQSGRSTPLMPTAAVGRFAARKPPSSISDIIHGGMDHRFLEMNNGESSSRPVWLPVVFKRPPAGGGAAPKPTGIVRPVIVESDMGFEGTLQNIPTPEPTLEVAAPTLQESPTIQIAPAVFVTMPRSGSVSPSRALETDDQKSEGTLQNISTPEPTLEVPAPTLQESPTIQIAPAVFVTMPRSGSVSPSRALETDDQSNALVVVVQSPAGQYGAPRPSSSTGNVSNGGAAEGLPVDANNGSEDNPQNISALSLRAPAGSTARRRQSQLNAQGYYDIIFYHKKLW